MRLLAVCTLVILMVCGTFSKSLDVDKEKELIGLMKRMDSGEKSVIASVIAQLHALMGSSDSGGGQQNNQGASTTVATTTPSGNSGNNYGAGSVLKCDFEKKEICGFTTKKDNTFKMVWRHYEGFTSTMETGPKKAASGQYYMYVEVSNLNMRDYKQNDKAWLTTPAITRKHNRYCLRFNYHMFGVHIGRLSLYMDPENADPTSLWEQEGAKDKDEWYEYSNSFDAPSGSSFKLAWETRRGSGVHGDIAIDNVRLDEGEC